MFYNLTSPLPHLSVTNYPLFLKCIGTYFPAAGLKGSAAGLSVLAVPEDDTGRPPSAGLESLSPAGLRRPSKFLRTGASAGEPSRPRPSRGAPGRHLAVGSTLELSSRGGAGEGAASVRPLGAGAEVGSRRAGGTYPPLFFGGIWTSSVVMSEGAAAGEGPLVGPSASLAAWRSRHVGLLPARARRGGPDGRSDDSVRSGAEGRAGTVRSGTRVPPLLMALILASATSSLARWMAALSSSSL